MKKLWCRWAILAIGSCLTVSACDDNWTDGPKYMGDDRLSPRSDWLISGELRDPHYAVDGNDSTAAVSGSDYQGATLTIDLGKLCQFNMVIVEQGNGRYGFPRRLGVLTSSDGVNFRKQMEVPGLRRVTTALLVQQVLARYVRLEAIVPGDKPWSVAEVHIY